MTQTPPISEEQVEAWKRLQDALDTFDADVSYHLDNESERSDLWEDIEVNANDLRSLLNAAFLAQRRCIYPRLHRGGGKSPGAAIRAALIKHLPPLASNAEYNIVFEALLAALLASIPASRGVTDPWIGCEAYDECATEGCDKPGVARFESGGIGSSYCVSCYGIIRGFLASPAPQPVQEQEPAFWHNGAGQVLAADALAMQDATVASRFTEPLYASPPEQEPKP